MLDAIHAKRAILLAQREQLVGQVNMTNGAIAICEELIAEGQRAAEVAKEVTQAEVDVLNREFARHGHPECKVELAADAAPEMLPVVHDEPSLPYHRTEADDEAVCELALQDRLRE